MGTEKQVSTEEDNDLIEVYDSDDDEKQVQEGGDDFDA